MCHPVTLHPRLAADGCWAVTCWSSRQSRSSQAAQRGAWAGWAFIGFFVFLPKNGKCKPHISLKGTAQARLYADFQMGYSDLSCLSSDIRISAVGSTAPCSAGLCSHQHSWAVQSPTEHQSRHRGGNCPISFSCIFRSCTATNWNIWFYFPPHQRSLLSLFFFFFFTADLFSPPSRCLQDSSAPGALRVPLQVMPFPMGAAVGTQGGHHECMTSSCPHCPT